MSLYTCDERAYEGKEDKEEVCT